MIMLRLAVLARGPELLSARVRRVQREQELAAAQQQRCWTQRLASGQPAGNESKLAGSRGSEGPGTGTGTGTGANAVTDSSLVLRMLSGLDQRLSQLLHTLTCTDFSTASLLAVLGVAVVGSVLVAGSGAAGSASLAARFARVVEVTAQVRACLGRIPAFRREGVPRVLGRDAVKAQARVKGKQGRSILTIDHTCTCCLYSPCCYYAPYRWRLCLPCFYGFPSL